MTAIDDYDPQSLATELARLKRSLSEVELHPSRFPPDLDVIDFAPGRRLRIRIHAPVQSLAELLHSIALYGMLAAALVASTGFAAVGWVAVAGLWLWRASLGPHLSINLAKRRFALIGLTRASWFDAPPKVELRESERSGRHTTSLYIAGYPVLKRVSDTRERHDDLVNFRNALAAELGFAIREEIAPGLVVLVALDNATDVNDDVDGWDDTDCDDGESGWD